MVSLQPLTEHSLSSVPQSYSWGQRAPKPLPALRAAPNQLLSVAMATVGPTFKACDGVRMALKPNIHGLPNILGSPRGLAFGGEVGVEPQRWRDDLEAPA